MQKNHSRKSHSKKNRYYKNVKEHKNMGKIEGTTEFIMMNRQVAHEKMCAIVKSMFEMAELDTDYINQPPYQSFVERFFGQFNNEPQLFCDKVLTSDRCFDALDRVLTADKEFAEVYNGLSYDEQFPLFLQLVSLLTCLNYADRAKMLYCILAVVAHANAANDEAVSMRAWMLYWFLIDPTWVNQEG